MGMLDDLPDRPGPPQRYWENTPPRPPRPTLADMQADLHSRVGEIAPAEPPPQPYSMAQDFMAHIPLALAGLGPYGRAGPPYLPRPYMPNPNARYSLSPNETNIPGEFQYAIRDAGRQGRDVGELYGRVRPGARPSIFDRLNPSSADIDWMGVEQPSVLSGGRYQRGPQPYLSASANTLGPGEIRGLLRDVRRDFPYVYDFAGGRISGAKARAVDRGTAVMPRYREGAPDSYTDDPGAMPLQRIRIR